MFFIMVKSSMPVKDIQWIQGGGGKGWKASPIP